MFQTDDKAVRYTNRGEVLHQLSILMHTALCPAERRAVLLHCGVGMAQPLPFQDIASVLAMPSPGHAKACYVRAIQKTRAAIPGSRLERYVAYYTPSHQEKRSGHTSQT